ncbi:MAG: hypothetical protein ABR549_04440 [Mycobacteriales bacterium]
MVIPEQRRAQERLWRALTKLDAVDQPGSDAEIDRDGAAVELMLAWAEYEGARAGHPTG